MESKNHFTVAQYTQSITLKNIFANYLLLQFLEEC